MQCIGLTFSRHAFERMFKRQFSPKTVATVIAEGEQIENYPDDIPFPSQLILGFHESAPVHVVVAREASSGMCHVITVYQPDTKLWNENFTVRKTI